jgi:hypothetical protein
LIPTKGVLSVPGGLSCQAGRHVGRCHLFPSPPGTFLNWTLASWVLALFVWLLPQSALADLTPLNGAAVAPNIAEINVREDGVYLSLEIYIGDLATFREILPDDFLNYDTTARPPMIERLRSFSDQKFQVLADGNKLSAELLVAEPRRRKDRKKALSTSRNTMSQLPTPEPPEDDRVFYVELKYPFATRPDRLQFIPPMKPNGTPEVSIGFVAFHETVAVIDFRYLSGPETLMLDWEDPWYTRFDNKNLKRHHTSALMTFLYVEPREVRHETLIRVRDLQDWMEFDLAGANVLDAPAQEAIKASARAYFASVNPVTIDGEPVEATSSRAEFLTVSSSGLQIAEAGDELDLPNAILGVILSFPVPALPQNVSVDWELFNERQASIQATATDPAGPFLNLISPDAPEFRWKNYLQTFEEPMVTTVHVPVQNTFPVPLLSIGLALAALIAAVLATRQQRTGRIVLLSSAGVGIIVAVLSASSATVSVDNPFDRLPDPETASRIFAAVLDNVNTANLETIRERRDAELTAVVSGGTIGDVTDELDRALAIRVAGGGLARVDTVQDVTLQDVRPLDRGNGFQAIASWTVNASAGHWGHNHKRNVSYRALVELNEDADDWKLAAITVVDAKQLN